MLSRILTVLVVAAAVATPILAAAAMDYPELADWLTQGRDARDAAIDDFLDDYAFAVLVIFGLAAMTFLVWGTGTLNHFLNNLTIVKYYNGIRHLPFMARFKLIVSIAIALIGFNVSNWYHRIKETYHRVNETKIGSLVISTAIGITVAIATTAALFGIMIVFGKLMDRFIVNPDMYTSAAAPGFMVVARIVARITGKANNWLIEDGSMEYAINHCGFEVTESDVTNYLNGQTGQLHDAKLMAINVTLNQYPNELVDALHEYTWNEFNRNPISNRISELLKTTARKLSN